MAGCGSSDVLGPFEALTPVSQPLRSRTEEMNCARRFIQITGFFFIINVITLANSQKILTTLFLKHQAH